MKMQPCPHNSENNVYGEIDMLGFQSGSQVWSSILIKQKKLMNCS